MRIVTYNVNGITARLPNLLRWLEQSTPDVVCLQELKSPQERFPELAIRAAGYGVVWHGQKSWNGVAILARGREPVEIRRALPGDTEDVHSRYIEARVDGVDRVPYRADTNALTIEVGQGFSGLAGPFYQPITELFVVDMLLAEPLAIGETATLEYSTSFHYALPPPREFRRVIQYFVENLDIRVEFHPDKLPSEVVWAVWDGMDGPIVAREPVALDSQFAVHRYLRLAEKTAAGFHWDW